MKVAIVGASGYTGLELIKIIIAHPKFDLTYVATSKGGENLEELHPSLKDIITLDVKKADAKKISKICDLVFLALPHKTAMGFVKELLALDVKVVDLSADYRLELKTYEKHYCSHEDRQNLLNAVYGLPEIYQKQIKKATLVANPGCYPTATLLALLPFTNYIDDSYPVVIDAKSGVSGAGKKCNTSTHYVSINENIFAYAPLSHRHQPEIKEKLFKFSNKNFDIKFVPHLIPITRGMLVSSYALLNEDIDPIKVLKEYYKDDEFVRIRETPVDIKMNVGTNYCDIFAKIDGRMLFVSSSIDNLLRGASSQAVVNANIMFGYDANMAIPIISYAP